MKNIFSFFDAGLLVTEKSDSISLDLIYRSDLFSQARVQEMTNQIIFLLSQVVGNLEENVGM